MKCAFYCVKRKITFPVNIYVSPLKHPPAQNNPQFRYTLGVPTPRMRVEFQPPHPCRQSTLLYFSLDHGA